MVAPITFGKFLNFPKTCINGSSSNFWKVLKLSKRYDRNFPKVITRTSKSYGLRYCSCLFDVGMNAVADGLCRYKYLVIIYPPIYPLHNGDCADMNYYLILCCRLGEYTGTEESLYCQINVNYGNWKNRP